jgi:hypothetical protein
MPLWVAQLFVGFGIRIHLASRKTSLMLPWSPSGMLLSANRPVRWLRCSIAG